MKKQQKTLDLISAAREVLELQNPMTLRQTYYQLVSMPIIDNNKNEYQKLSVALVWARKKGIIPWEWLEDRTRQPRQVSMWSNLTSFFDTVKRSYRKNVWENQENHVVLWVEKDALSGIFQRIADKYGVTLVVGRLYFKISSLVKETFSIFFRLI